MVWKCASCLESHRQALGLGTCEYFVAMQRDQRLVGGDHVLAVVEGAHHQFARWISAADQLDHDLDSGIVYDREWIGREANAVGVDRPLLAEIPRRRRHHFDIASGAACDLIAVARQHVERAAADRTQTEHADFDRR